MRHDGVDRDEERLGYLFVREAFHDLHDDFLLALAQVAGLGRLRLFLLLLRHGFAATAAHIVLQPADALGKERVLHVAVAVQVFVRHEDVHEDLAHERGVVVAGIVFHDDALQLGEAFLDAGVLFVVLFLYIGKRLVRQASLQQGLDVGVHVGVLERHVALHLLGIFVVETQDKHGDAVGARQVERLQELAPDARQTEVHEVAVRVLQVGDECRQVDLLGHLADTRMCGVLHVVHDGEEGIGVHACGAAGGPHGLVAEAEADAEAADDLQDAVVVADDVAHGVRCMVFLGHKCAFLAETAFGRVLFLFSAKVQLLPNMQG